MISFTSLSFTTMKGDCKLQDSICYSKIKDAIESNLTKPILSFNVVLGLSDLCQDFLETVKDREAFFSFIEDMAFNLYKCSTFFGGCSTGTMVSIYNLNQSNLFWNRAGSNVNKDNFDMFQQNFDEAYRTLRNLVIKVPDNYTNNIPNLSVKLKEENCIGFHRDFYWIRLLSEYTNMVNHSTANTSDKSATANNSSTHPFRLKLMKRNQAVYLQME